MKQPRRLLAQTIAKRTAHLTDTKKLAQEVAAYLVAENRVSELAPIMRDVMVIRKEQGVVEADIVSAFPLSESAVQDVIKLVHATYPHAKQVQIVQQTSSDTLGGLKVVMPDEQLDLSVKHKLSIFKHAAVAGKE
jgi:F0F1-type ATP synthase delta subunit